MNDSKKSNHAAPTEVDLAYDAKTFVGKFSRSAFRKYEKRFQELKGVKFDPSYVQHISRHYGGIPRKQCFKTRKGTTRRLGRFLNYLDRQSVEPPIGKSWQGHGDNDESKFSNDPAIEKVADNFDDFLGMLREYKPTKQPKKKP